MIKSILIAYDGSETAEKAFDYAVALAQKFQVGLEVLAVAQLPDPPEDVETEAIIERARSHYTKLYGKLLHRAAATGVKPSFKIGVGHPAEQIVAHAEAAGANLIVLGHRGRSAVERWLTGSVTKAVMSYAHCAVMIVR